MIGTTLGHYRVLEKLGEGGMGVVYKAQDLHLDRPVALKVLPPEKVTDPDRKQRFTQEAKAASALNHPNIITVHDIARDGGVDFIAMEYIAGKTLDQLIPRKGMRLGEVLKVAVQVADALVTAHAAGIVHRDIKPSNVMVSDQGRVKVLDFGLVKLTGRDESLASQMTTGAAVQTDAGRIVGTVSYMSPEQAQGRPVDERSDIFSFGTLLYEMVSGQRPFQGESSMHTLAAILEKDPPPVAADVPHDVQKFITRCLRKDPERRFQHMKDLRVELEELKEESDSGTLLPAGQAATPRFRWGWGIVMAAAAVLLLAVGWFWFGRLRVVPAEAPSAPVPLTTWLGSEVQPSFSPDGKKLAFAWNGEKEDNYDIYVKQVDSPDPAQPLVTNPAEDTSPAWSPDDKRVAFLRREGSRVAIVLISSIGGPERALSGIADVRLPRSLGSQLSWSPDGKWLAYSGQAPGERQSIWAVQVDTLEHRRLTTIPTPTQGGAAGASDYCPSFSPDGHWLAFARQLGGYVAELYRVPIAQDLRPAGEPERIYEQRHPVVGGIAWTADGRDLVYSAGNDLTQSLWRVSVSGGPPLRMPWPNGTYPAVSGTANRLVYTEWIRSANLWRLDTDTGERTRLIGSTGTNVLAHYSPDGHKIAYQSDETGNQEIYTCDAEGKTCQRLTDFGGPVTGTPRWSPDGQRLAFDSRATGQSEIYVMPAAGPQPQQPVTHSAPFSSSQPSWSHDGGWIYHACSRAGRAEICKVPKEGGEEFQVTRLGGNAPFVSPDGQYLYYTKGSPPGLVRMPAVGGKEQQVLPRVSSMQNFAVGVRGVYFTLEPRMIQLLDVATGKVSTVATLDTNALGICVSPDDRYVVWSQVDREARDLKLIEHFR